MPLQPTAAEGETVINGFICWSTAENNRVCYGNDRCPRSGGAGRCRSLVGAFPRARRGARWWMGRGKLGTGAGVLVEGSLISHRVKTPPPRLYTHPPGHCPCACCAAVAELALHVTSFLSFFSFSKKVSFRDSTWKQSGANQSFLRTVRGFVLPALALAGVWEGGCGFAEHAL